MLIFIQRVVVEDLRLRLLSLQDAVLLDEFDLERRSLLMHGPFKFGKRLTLRQRDLIDQDICTIHTKKDRLTVATERDGTLNLRTVRSRLQEVDNDSHGDLRQGLGDRLRRVLGGRRRYCCTGGACR